MSNVPMYRASGGIYRASEVANLKPKNATIAFSLHFLSSRSRFFYFPLLFWPFFLLQVSLGSFSKNRLDVLSIKDAFHTQTA